MYPPIISKHLFDQCQSVISGKNRKRYVYCGHDHIFRGLLTCAVTGKTVSIDVKKKTYKNGGVDEWKYLVAADPENPAKKIWVREKDVLAQAEEVFAKIQIPDHIKQEVITYIRKTSEAEKEFHRNQIRELQKEQENTQTKLNKLLDLLVEDAIQKEDYNHKRTQLHQKQADIRQQIEALELTDAAFKENLMRLLDVANNALTAFRGSEIAQKHKLLNFVFQNLSLRGKTLCYSLRKPFDGFVECSKTVEWRALVDRLRTNLQDRVLIVQFFDNKALAVC